MVGRFEGGFTQVSLTLTLALTLALTLTQADRLLDMGFEETLTAILQLLDKKRKEGDAGRHRRQTVRLTCCPGAGGG